LLKGINTYYIIQSNVIKETVMTDNKKKKDIMKSSTRRKEISTFSKFIEAQTENQKKQIKALFGSPNILADHLKFLSRLESDQRLLGLPSEQRLEEIARQVENLPTGFEELIRIRESIPDHLLEGLENSKIILDSQKMFENILSIEREELQKIEGMMMNLQMEDIRRSIDENKTLNVELKEIKPINDIRNQFILRTRTEESIEIGKIQLRTVQETHMQVQHLQLEVKDIKETIVEDAKKKDEMLEELVKFARTGGNNLVRIDKLKYNRKSSELIINEKTIKIQADTNQHYLCKILFNSKTSIKKDWEIYDIVEAFGEDTDMLKEWQEIIYNTVRHLNYKIQSVTGLEKFILYSNKKVIVNPNYIDLS